MNVQNFRYMEFPLLHSLGQLPSVSGLTILADSHRKSGRIVSENNIQYNERRRWKAYSRKNNGIRMIINVCVIGYYTTETYIVCMYTAIRKR